MLRREGLEARRARAGLCTGPLRSLQLPGSPEQMQLLKAQVQKLRFLCILSYVFLLGLGVAVWLIC